MPTALEPSFWATCQPHCTTGSVQADEVSSDYVTRLSNSGQAPSSQSVVEKPSFFALSAFFCGNSLMQVSRLSGGAEQGLYGIYRCTSVSVFGLKRFLVVCHQIEAPPVNSI